MREWEEFRIPLPRNKSLWPTIREYFSSAFLLSSISSYNLEVWMILGYLGNLKAFSREAKDENVVDETHKFEKRGAG